MHRSDYFDDSFRSLGRRGFYKDRLYLSIASGCVHLEEENHGYRGGSEGSERAGEVWNMEITHYSLTIVDASRPFRDLQPSPLSQDNAADCQSSAPQDPSLSTVTQSLCLTCHHFIPLATL